MYQRNLLIAMVASFAIGYAANRFLVSPMSAAVAHPYRSDVRGRAIVDLQKRVSRLEQVERYRQQADRQPQLLPRRDDPVAVH